MENNENKITIKELLETIDSLIRQVNALNIAFSYLPFTFTGEQLRPTLEALRIESVNPRRDAPQQEVFRVLVAEIESRMK